MPLWKKVFVFTLLLALGASPADAQRFTRLKGVLKVTYFEDSLGTTLADLPTSSRRVIINERISRSPAPGIRQTCSDNKAMKQRVCTQRYNFEVQGQGSCKYVRKIIFNNWSSSSRTLVAYFEVAAICPSGYAAYFLADGSLRRS